MSCQNNCDENNNFGYATADKRDIIMLKDNLLSEDENMSIMYIGINNVGAVVATDSRETKCDFFNDNKEKIYFNDDIIVGQIGLYSTEDVDFYEIFKNGLLNGKSVEEILKMKITKTKTVKNLIPLGQRIDIYYAKRNGEIGIYYLTQNEEVKNRFSNSSAYWCGFNNGVVLLDKFNELYPCNLANYSLDEIETKLKLYLDTILKIEANYHQKTPIASAVGGEVMMKTIKFSK